MQNPFPFIFEQEFVFKEIHLEEKIKDFTDRLNASFNITQPAFTLSDIIRTKWNTLEASEFDEKFVSLVEGTNEPLTNDVEHNGDYGNQIIAFRRNLIKRSVDGVLDADNSTQGNDSLVHEYTLKLSTWATFEESKCWPR